MKTVPFPPLQTASIDSPCIGVCTLNGRGLCQGCARTMDEITRWSEMSAAERQRVMGLIVERRAGAQERA